MLDSATNVDSTYWVYTYDSLGQVTSGKKYWADGTPAAGQQFEYAFDDIGNRTSTAQGGDQFGGSLRTANYSANSLNQYTNRDVPGFVNIVGSAATNATVSIWADNTNFTPTYRHADYFRGELAVNNSTGAIWLTITNVGVLRNGTNADIVTNIVGNAFLPQTQETFTNDLDGNVLRDGRWTNSWDALQPMEPNPQPRPPRGGGALIWRPYVPSNRVMQSPSDQLREWMGDPTSDYVWVCHSQGCNIAMHFLRRGCVR